MKCVECREREVEWLLFWDTKYLLVCQGCLDSYIHIEGEINLDFWLLSLGDFQTIFNDVNRRLDYWRDMYERAYKGEFRQSIKETVTEEKVDE